VTFEIEKGIPVPPKWSGLTRKYPLDTMEIGDSFYVKATEYETNNTVRQRLKSSIRAFCLRCDQPKAFETRVVGDGVRVWRIA